MASKMAGVSMDTPDSKCPEDQSCPYFTQLQAYEYSQQALEHFDIHRHEMIQCLHGKQCYAFQRLIGGGYRLDDRCHCAIYKHPSRRDNAHIEKALGSKKFISAPVRLDCNMSTVKISPLKHHKGDISGKDYKDHGDSLMKELKVNGFEWVMQIPNYDADKSAKVQLKGPKTLWDVAAEKMDHPRHEEMGKPLSLVEILAILLYTGTDAYSDHRYNELMHWKNCMETKWFDNPYDNYNRSSIRDIKWPIFSSILSQAINELYMTICKSDPRRPEFIYHGLQDIVVDPDEFSAESSDTTDGNHGYSALINTFMYGTFVSTSTSKDIALQFMESDDLKSTGCLMEIHLGTSFIRGMRGLPCVGADVSWISKFPYECEFLLDKCQVFDLDSIDYNETEDYQIAHLVKVKNPVTNRRY